MSCKLNPPDEYLDNYLFGRLSENESELFEKHFIECEECSEELAFRRKIMEAFRNGMSSKSKLDVDPDPTFIKIDPLKKKNDFSGIGQKNHSIK